MKFKICLIPVLVAFFGCACIFAQGQDGGYINHGRIGQDLDP